MAEWDKHPDRPFLLNVGGRVATIGEQQLRELIDKHAAAMSLYARLWCHAPDDIVQESLIALIQADPAPSNPLPWTYAVIRRKGLNLARAERRRNRHHRAAMDLREQWFVSPSNAAPAINLETCLKQLPAIDREIVVARIWGDLTFQQIAELVGRPLSSVNRRYRRALRRLEEIITSSNHDRSTPDEQRTPIG
ncbi:MAG TPA: sigma-70 family RNA polymerase sigma factor [Planctomycetaceae bacterium]|nr:sigma-70 family RNA polymerase sigma factor [Planctomycetaceae bacterium]